MKNSKSKVRRRARPYQVAQIAAGLDETKSSVLIVSPTGSGKTFVMSKIASRFLRKNPGSRVLIVSHNLTLVRQTHAELVNDINPNKIGICAAAAGQKTTDRPVTIATINTVYKLADTIEPVDLILIDEAHRATACRATAKMYPTLIARLRERNSMSRIVGFTATPWRTGGKCIFHVEGEDNAGRIFLEKALPDVEISDLIEAGYLSNLTSKSTAVKLDTTGIQTRSGDFDRKALAKCMNNGEVVRRAIAELVTKGEDRKRWLLFCVSIKHAGMVRQALHGHGVIAEIVTGETPDDVRQEVEGRLERGELHALINVDVYCEGFNVKPIDLIALLRPTRSPTRYVQMVGRGARTSPGKSSCLVLDFGGNVARFGPINDLAMPKNRSIGAGDGEQPTRTCPECEEIVAASVRQCPACGREIPEPIAHSPLAGQSVIVAKDLPTSDSVKKEILKIAELGESLNANNPKNYGLVSRAKRVFGTWSSARRAAGVPNPNRDRIKWSKAMIVEEIKRLKASGYTNSERRSEWGRVNQASHKIFGSSKAAMAAAGFEVYKEWTPDSLVKEILKSCPGKVSPSTKGGIPQSILGAARRIFGSWSKACASCGVVTRRKSRKLPIKKSAPITSRATAALP